MQISDILRYKQENHVWTIGRDATIADLLAQLAEHHIGAMIVTGPDAPVAGIVSERDIVRQLHARGAAVLDSTVETIMTADVVHCALNDTIDTVATLMTEQRIRHLPVLDEGRLVGVVSIGDVVSSRMRQLEKDRSQLEQYITG
ncbi:MAG: CBS domain-containing protein [Jatrophihabitantaceae bacterium]